jgi:hypothetical protein
VATIVLHPPGGKYYGSKTDVSAHTISNISGPTGFNTATNSSELQGLAPGNYVFKQ